MVNASDSQKVLAHGEEPEVCYKRRHSALPPLLGCAGGHEVHSRRAFRILIVNSNRHDAAYII